MTIVFYVLKIVIYAQISTHALNAQQVFICSTACAWQNAQFCTTSMQHHSHVNNAQKIVDLALIQRTAADA